MGNHPAQMMTGDRHSTLPLVGAAFGIGLLLAKFLDWRGHAHPRV